jgi:hypothetical protein
LLIAWLWCAALGGTSAWADIRPQDQLWVINSRGLGGRSTEKIAERLVYHRYLLEKKGWASSNLAGFMAEPAHMTTCFLVPGNYYTHAEAIRVGWYAYHRLVGQGADARPLRFVIWSWPADPVPGRRLLDARIKFGRLDEGALHLASLLDQFDRATPVSLVGSSFGGGIIVGALHLLGGGTLGPYRLTAGDRAPHHVKAVLIAAAFDNDWLMAGHKYGLAMTQMERMLLFVNPRDLPLFFYKRLYFRRSRARAIGREGPAGLGCVIGGEKIDLFNSHAWLGHHHGVRPYFQATGLVNAMRPYLLMWPRPASPAKAAAVKTPRSEPPPQRRVNKPR